MKHLRILLVVLILFVVTSVAFARTSWMPLPQVAGPDLGPSSTAWRPNAQVSCSSFYIEVISPSMEQGIYGVEEVRWYVEGLYDFDGNLIASETGEFALFNYNVDGDPAGDNGVTRGKSFNITNPLQPGDRTFVRVYKRIKYFGTALGDPTATDDIGDNFYSDRWLRAYDPVPSNDDGNTATRQYSCGVDLAAQPKVRLNVIGGTSQPEGNSNNDVQIQAQLLNDSDQPTTTNVPVWVYIKAKEVRDEREPSGGTIYDTDFQLFDANNVKFPLAETIDVPYNHNTCGSSDTYCFPPPPDKEIAAWGIIPAGQSSYTFKLRILGDTIPEPNDLISFTLEGVSNARRDTTSFTYTIADDDQKVVNVQDVEVSFCGVTDGATVVVPVPIVMEGSVSANVDFEYTTGSSNMQEFIQYLRLPSHPSPSNPVEAQGKKATITAGGTQTTANIDLYKVFFGANFATGSQYVDVFVSRWELWDWDSIFFSWEYVYTAAPFISGDTTARITRLPFGPNVTINDVAVSEDGGSLVFTVTLAEDALDPGGNPSPVTIGYQTVDGTAIAGQDYTATSGTITFDVVSDGGPPTLDKIKTITVPITNENDFEPNETFTVQLIDPAGVCIQDGVGQGTINNDDVQPTVNILDASAAEAAGTMSFTVELSAKSSQVISMNYATSDDSAIAGTDYVAKNGTLNFPAGTTSDTITIDLIDDATINDDLTFNITLTNLNNVTAGDLVATGTILDDDKIDNLVIQGDLAEAPLDLVFTWTHQPEPGQSTVPSEWYRLWITKDAVDVFSKWYQAPNICSGNACAVPFQDFDIPYLLTNGTYDWVIEGYKDPTTTSSLPAQFAINFAAPAQPTISGVDTTYGQPTVMWDRDANTTWYLVEIFDEGNVQVYKKWTTKTAACDVSSCMLATNAILPEGNYNAYVKGWGPQKFGPQSTAYPFSIVSPYPDAPTSLSVTGQNDGSPTFSWTGSNDATYHHIQLTKLGTTKLLLDKWYTAGELGCLGGGTCSITPPLNLNNNTYDWQAQSWGPSGFNDNDKTIWSADTFMVSAPVPGLVSGISILNANTGEPTFEWTPASDATWYNIKVENTNTAAVEFQKWYQGTAIGCGGDTCSVKPTIYLKNGDYQISIRAWGPGGWNNGDKNTWGTHAFSVAATLPDAPTLIAPSESISDPTPEFSWNSVSSATWYKIWVEYNGSRIYQKWFSAAALGCSGGGSCTASDPNISLNPATYLWKVRAYSPAGTGPWSSTLSFEIVP